MVTVNYYQPRQVNPDANRPDAGKWRYTCKNDDQVWAVGYCAQGCPGHASQKGAYQHQTDYILDKARYDNEWLDAKYHCEVENCEEWTSNYVSFGPGQMGIYDLCDTHRNRETLTILMGSVGDSFGSY